MPVRAEPDTFMPILGIRAGDVPERILVVGDPARAERVAGLLTDARELARNREYVTFGGQHHDQYVGVVSHGVGSPGATVCFEELCRSGARRLIRAGTAGGLQPAVTDGTLVVAHAAVRCEGVTRRLVPPEFPATANIDDVLALRTAAAEIGNVVIEGVVLTADLFYPHDVLGGDLEMWQRAGVVAVEMECAALFITAALHRVSAAAILAIDGNPLAEADEDMSGYDPHRQVVTDAVDAMIAVGLDVVAGPLATTNTALYGTGARRDRVI
ncbi:MAG: nucleoside phosphorylase [Ilumatobacter sp.]